MSDEFADLFSVDDAERRAHPMRSAQAAMRKPLPKRFYERAEATPFKNGFRLTLDGKPALTPRRQPIALRSEPALMLIAAEWSRQGEVIDPAAMPATRIVNAAIDHVAFAMDEVRADLCRYAGSDLICYRASEPARLAELQQQHWSPLHDWAQQRLGVALRLTNSIQHVAQDEALLRAYERAIAAIDGPAALAALHVMVTLSGSAIIALAAAEGVLSAEAAFDASEVDADFEVEVWGVDDEAAARRAYRLSEFKAAAELFAALRG